MSTECWIDTEQGACCCTCVNHRKDLSHPETNGGRIAEQRGWICLAPEFDGAFSEWDEHGLCEMWIAAPNPGGED